MPGGAGERGDVQGAEPAGRASVSGTILPFGFHPDLELVVDPRLLEHPEIFFNAARLDRSLALNTQDYQDHLRRIGAQIRPITAGEA